MGQNPQFVLLCKGVIEQNNNLQVEKKMEEEENKAGSPDEGNEAMMDEGGDRNKDGRSKADDRNKEGDRNMTLTRRP